MRKFETRIKEVTWMLFKHLPDINGFVIIIKHPDTTFYNKYIAILSF